MSIEIMTSVRAVVFRTPACRLDRPMGEVHVGGRRRETCMARLNGGTTEQTARAHELARMLTAN